MDRIQTPLVPHSLKNILLISLSLAFLPLTSSLVLLSFGISLIYHKRKWQPAFQVPRPRRVLVTGVGMTKGLFLARIFSAAGHVVIGADFSSLACGRVSNCISSFHQLESPGKVGKPSEYAKSLLALVEQEQIDLWVSCSGVSSAVLDGEACETICRSTHCKAVQFDVETTEKLHEKHNFIEYTRNLSLPVPETYTVESRSAMDKVLGKAREKKFVAKNVGVDDASRGDMTLLPRPTPAETANHLDRLSVSPDSPWILQQFVAGQEFCTHALVIRGEVKAFVACESSEMLMHYARLPPDSALSRAMLKFTQIFAARSGQFFTGHLSFDFLTEDIHKQDPDEVTLYPIECNPRAHTAVALFNGTTKLVDAYMMLLEPEASAEDPGLVVPVKQEKYYWIGHDLVCFLILPFTSLLSGHESLPGLVQKVKGLINHVLFWKDGTYDLWDPVPWWWLYHVYWPAQFLDSLVSGRAWSRVNVSTTKMFAC